MHEALPPFRTSHAALLAFFLATACLMARKPVYGAEVHKLVGEAHKSALVELQTRPGVTQTYLLIEPEEPAPASAILFAGGHGVLKLGRVDGRLAFGWGRSNFLVRSRDLFVEQGLAVAVVDAPSDRQDDTGMLYGFRTSSRHLADIEAVISDLRSRVPGPVWLIGTSRGTESAAHCAIHGKAGIDGLVLTATITKPTRKGMAVTRMDLERVRVPTLVVHHAADACKVTPAEGARWIVKGLRNAVKAELRLFEGGAPPKSSSCRALSAHGFYGIEREVVNAIASFIKSVGK